MENTTILRKLSAILFVIFLFFCTFFHFHKNFQHPLSTQQLTDQPFDQSFVWRQIILNAETDKAKNCLNESLEERQCINVIIAANGPYLIPTMACINSIFQNTGRNVFVHVLMEKGEASIFSSALRENDLLKHKNPIELVEFRDSHIAPLIKVWEGKSLSIYNNTFNYARYYLPSIFPRISNMIYLDPDTVVVTDIGKLWDLFTSILKVNNNKEKVNNFESLIKKHSNMQERELWNGEMDKILFAVSSKPTKSGSVCGLLNCDDIVISQIVKDKDSKYFNAGVFATNLEIWRKENITERLEYWLKINKQRKLWKWGSQGAMALVFYDRWQELPSSWNDRNARKQSSSPRSANIYHFTTDVKPWLDSGNKAIWDIWCPYYPLSHSLPFCLSSIRGDSSIFNPTSPFDYSFLCTNSKQNPTLSRQKK